MNSPWSTVGVPPDVIRGHIVAGRRASATHKGEAALGGELKCRMLAKAARVSAAVAVYDGVLWHSLNAVQLRGVLRKEGVLI